MKLKIDGVHYQVWLVDDGTLDTVIEINDIEHRFSTEYAAHWRDETGALSDEGLEVMARDAIDHDDRHWDDLAHLQWIKNG